MTVAVKMAHLFHWPSRPEYQENFAQMIALPVGAKGQLYIGKKWVNKTFDDEIQNINSGMTCSAVYWLLSCRQKIIKGKAITTFKFAYPLRLIDIVKVESREDDRVYIDFVAQAFLYADRMIKSLAELEDYTKIKFGVHKVPSPGMENGFAHIGLRNKDMVTNPTLSLAELYAVIEKIPGSIDYKQGPMMKDYPLIAIKSIEDATINKSGLFELLLDREYRIDLSYFQGEPLRYRTLHINGNRCVGKSGTGKIPLERVRKGQAQINVEIRGQDLSFQVPLGVKGKVLWYRRKWLAFITLLVISAVIFFVFIWMYPDSDTKTRLTLLLPLIILSLGKFWEIWS